MYIQVYACMQMYMLTSVCAYVYMWFLYMCVYIYTFCLKTTMYEYSYFDYIVSHVHIEKEKKRFRKKIMSKVKW